MLPYTFRIPAWLRAEFLVSQSPRTDHACIANTIGPDIGILLPLKKHTALSYIRLLLHGRQAGVFLIMASTLFV